LLPLRLDEIVSTPVRIRVRRPPRSDGESRWAAAIATLVAISLYALLPSTLLIGPRYVIPALEGIILIAVIAANPLRMTNRSRHSRIATLSLTFLIMATNLVALVLLLHRLVAGGGQGGQLLLAALQV